MLDFTTITKVPCMPEFLRGAINLRGSAVPVVDLRLNTEFIKGMENRTTSSSSFSTSTGCSPRRRSNWCKKKSRQKRREERKAKLTGWAEAGIDFLADDPQRPGYFFAYKPISSVWARIWLFIAASTAVLPAFGASASTVSRA